MNENSIYQAVRIGDVADWKLIVEISATGMSAYLKNINPAEDVLTLFEEKWKNDPEALLTHIEGMVYDHPQVLDDFSTEIAIVTPQALLFPAEMVDDDEDEAIEIYGRIYCSEPEDVMMCDIPGAVCLFTLVPGLRAFLQRTFPGAAVKLHLAVLAARFAGRTADTPRIYLDIRDKEADFIVYDIKRLLSASTHKWETIADIEYHLFNLIDVYGLNPADLQVSVSGLKEQKAEIVRELRKYISYVMLTMIPGIGVKSGMSLCAAMMMRG
ncbi:MAG: DUF3822 family protein [Candidatus Amulumruptor caecigallinarius]|nr:DUF3822 family protein [Candidatus Amulumruptor caecigallinarius]